MQGATSYSIINGCSDEFFSIPEQFITNQLDSSSGDLAGAVIPMAVSLMLLMVLEFAGILTAIGFYVSTIMKEKKLLEGDKPEEPAKVEDVEEQVKKEQKVDDQNVDDQKADEKNPGLQRVGSIEVDVQNDFEALPENSTKKMN